MSFLQLRSPFFKNNINSPAVPSVLTSDASNITSTTADGNGYVWEDNNSAITQRGFCYSSTNSTPTTSDNTKIVSGTTGSMTGTITGLASSTLYYYRAYAINAYGTGYGTVYTFTTSVAGVSTGVPNWPVLTGNKFWSPRF